MLKKQMVQVEQEKVRGYICDVCKKEFEDDRIEDIKDGHLKYEDMAVIEHQYGEYDVVDDLSYGENNYLTLHICPECFKDFVDFMKSKGVELNYEKKAWGIKDAINNA